MLTSKYSWKNKELTRLNGLLEYANEDIQTTLTKIQNMEKQIELLKKEMIHLNEQKQFAMSEIELVCYSIENEEN